MSGGSMDYLSYKVDDVADQLEDIELIDLAKDFANLLHECEWYQSGDTSRGQYNNAVQAFKKKWFGSREARIMEYVDSSLQSTAQKIFEMVGCVYQCKECKHWRKEQQYSEYGECTVKEGKYLMHGGEYACDNFQKAGDENESGDN